MKIAGERSKAKGERVKSREAGKLESREVEKWRS
jgi:hypothetical protein